MTLEDLLAMEVPVKQLRHVCTSNKLKPEGNSSEVLAKCISLNTKLYPEAKLLVDEFQYAGKTTVRLYKPLSNIPGKLNNIVYFGNLLKEEYGDKIFTTGIKPESTEIPKLFKAVEYEGKYYLSFVYLGQERRIFRNYEIVKETPQIVDFLVVHFNPLLLQARVPMIKDKLFKQSFLSVIGINDSIEWLNITTLSNSEILTLRKNLNCDLIGAKHKMDEGIYDTIEVRAKPGFNLADEPDYKKEYNGKPIKNARMEFLFKYSNGLEETVSFKVTPEGINFYNEVSEVIIQIVINCILNIKNTANDQAASTTE